MSKHSNYCPFCKKDVEPINADEVESGEDESYIYVHDDVYHDPDYDYGGMH